MRSVIKRLVNRVAGAFASKWTVLFTILLRLRCLLRRSHSGIITQTFLLRHDENFLVSRRRVESFFLYTAWIEVYRSNAYATWCHFRWQENRKFGYSRFLKKKKNKIWSFYLYSIIVHTHWFPVSIINLLYLRSDNKAYNPSVFKRFLHVCTTWNL